MKVPAILTFCLLAANQTYAKGPTLVGEYFCAGGTTLSISKLEDETRIRYDKRFYYPDTLPGAQHLGSVPCMNSTATHTAGALKMTFKGICDLDKLGGTLSVFDSQAQTDLKMELLLVKKNAHTIEQTRKVSVLRNGKVVEGPDVEVKTCVRMTLD